MLNFVEMIEIYKSVGIYNHTFECLLSNNSYKQSYAMNQLRNLKSKGDVLLYIANI